MKIVIDIPENTYRQIQALVRNEYFEHDICGNSMRRIANGTPLPKCNECKYYEGVRKVQGHAPCSYHTIGGVMWDWYCSQFEADKGSESV